MYYYLINNAGLMTTRGSYTQHYIILNDNIYWKMRVVEYEKKSEKMKNEWDENNLWNRFSMGEWWKSQGWWFCLSFPFTTL